MLYCYLSKCFQNCINYTCVPLYKLIKGKALRKHSLHGKKAALVLLKMFISGNESCYTNDAP